MRMLSTKHKETARSRGIYKFVCIRLFFFLDYYQAYYCNSEDTARASLNPSQNHFHWRDKFRHIALGKKTRPPGSNQWKGWDKNILSFLTKGFVTYCEWNRLCVVVWYLFVKIGSPSCMDNFNDFLRKRF